MSRKWGSRSVRFRFTLGITLWIAISIPSLSTGEEHSDPRSLARLFGDELSSNVLEMRGRTRIQPLETKYQTLFNHVLPPETNEIRIAIDFVPTNPSPPVVEKYGSAASPMLPTLVQNWHSSGGALISPALDLVQVAQQLGKLEELAAEIARRSSTEAEQIKSRSSMMILLTAAKGNFESYARRLNEFMALVREAPITELERGPEMVVIWQGTSQPETRRAIRDLLLLLQEQMKFGKYRHRERIKRHIFSLVHLLDELIIRNGSTPREQLVADTLEHWHVVSRDRAATRGNGYPNAAWTMAPTRARHVSSHGSDYFYYACASPLRGNFEIEGDLSTFAYLIARRSGQPEQELIGRIEVGQADVPLDTLGAGVHTGGSGQETVVRFKSLTIHAEEFK